MMHFIGIDAHQKTCSLHVLDAEGKTLAAVTCATKHEELMEALEPYLPARIVIEATTVSERVARACESAAKAVGAEVEVVVADPNYRPMYAFVTKTDKLDAKALAMAARVGNYKVVHRKGAVSREVCAVLEGREILVKQRTEVINHVRAKLVERDLPTPSCDAEAFHKRVDVAGVSGAVRESLDRMVKQLKQLEPLIIEAEQQLDSLVKTHEVPKRLVQVPGIGPVTALYFFALIDDPSRFKSAGSVANYFGLTPKEHSSGEQRVLGRITKRGQPRMRTALFQASGAVLRSKNPKAAQMQQWGLRLYNKKNWGIACTALSRKLCGILFSMWRDGTSFEPTRSAAQTDKVYVLKSKRLAAQQAARALSGGATRQAGARASARPARAPAPVVRRRVAKT